MSGNIRELSERLRRRGRLPAFYVYENDGWLHCRGCHVGVIAAEGAVPTHAPGCRVAEMEANNG